MATTIYGRNLKTYPRAVPQTAYQDMLRANPLTTAKVSLTDTAATGSAERPIRDNSLPMRFWSERVAAQVTISGAITFDIKAAGSTGFTGIVRAYLSKITAGGSAIETLIGQADASAGVTTISTTFTFGFTPAVAVTVAPGERFICQVTMMPVSGSFGSAGAWGQISYGSGSASGTCSVTLTETVTFTDNGYILFLRNSASGIGSFKDLSTTRNTGTGSNGVVNTTAGGTEIQWTATAGGSALEWISARIANPGWTVDTIDLFGFSTTIAPVTVQSAPCLWALESNVAANASTRMKLFRRKPDGTELLAVTWTYTFAELTTSNTVVKMYTAGTSRVLAQNTNFAEDDRLVLRVYLVNHTVLTMGGGFTATLQYDGITASASGDCFLTIMDSPAFKASGDPDGTSRITSGLAMGGVGN